MRLFKTRPQLSREQALSVRPLRAEARLEILDAGGARIIVSLRPRRWLGIRSGDTRTYEFDAVGLAVWQQCDGTKTVQEIAAIVSDQTNLCEADSQVATRRFLHMLATRGLIGAAHAAAEKSR